MKRIYYLTFFISVLFFTACSNDTSPAKDEKDETIDINGIGFFEDELYMAWNSGMKVYRDGKWQELEDANKEYLSLESIIDGFIFSGKDQETPLGIVKWNLAGQKETPISFHKKDIFHFISSDYNGNYLYAIQSSMDNPELEYGLHYSSDGGKTWSKAKLDGFQADSMGMVSAHPTNGHIIALATREGIYLSNDSGNTFVPLISNEMVTALKFGYNDIYFCSINEKEESVYLKKYSLESNEVENISIPYLDFSNPITYIAMNHEQPNQIAFSTYQGDLFVSDDSGENWTQLLFKGEIKQ